MSTFANLNPAAAAPVPSAGQSPGTNPFAELKSTDFVRIMVEELSNQDPFEPNDSAAILEQLSGLRSIESDLALQDQLKSLVLQNSIGQAGALIGRQAEGLDINNDVIRGTVTSVKVVGGKTELQLDSGRSLPIDRITAVREQVRAAASVAPNAAAVTPASAGSSPPSSSAAPAPVSASG